MGSIGTSSILLDIFHDDVYGKTTCVAKEQSTVSRVDGLRFAGKSLSPPICIELLPKIGIRFEHIILHELKVCRNGEMRYTFHKIKTFHQSQ